MAGIQQEYKIVITDETKSGVTSRASAAPVEQAKGKEQTPSKPENRKPVRNDLKALAAVTAVYGIARQAGQIYVNTVSSRHAIEGNNLKQQRLQTDFQNISTNVGFGLAAAYGLASMNPAVILGTVAAYGQRIYNLELQMNRFNAQVQNEIHRSQYARERLVRYISEVR